jgi:hypothetical protein
MPSVTNKDINFRLRHLWWIVPIIGVIALVAVLSKTGRPTMPSYQGRSAESWLGAAFNMQITTHSQQAFFTAFQSMGTNGISFLLDSIDWKASFSEKAYASCYAKLPLTVQRRIPSPRYPKMLGAAANLVLLNVRDSAPERTLPRLVQLLSANDPQTRQMAAGLIQHYMSNYPRLDYSAFRPQLVQALNDTDDWTRILAAIALINAKLAGPEVVSALKSSLTNSQPDIRQAAQITLDRLETTNSLAP